MPSTLNATFESRRAAELAIEHLVQELGIERTDIFVTTEGDENSAGTETDGSDGEAGAPSPDERSDAALRGGIVVSVDVRDDGKAEAIRQALAEQWS